MLEAMHWYFNADDIDSWNLTSSYPNTSPYITFNWKEDNSRNIVVSVQEAQHFAQMWVEFRHSMADNQNPPTSIWAGNVPDHVVV